MEDSIVLREWTSIDEVPDLLDVWKSSVECRLDFLSAHDLDAVATALESIYSQTLHVRIAQQGDQILGFAAWNDSEIEILWVRHADRHHGVGRLLLSHIIEHSPEAGVHLDAQRTLAIEFFQNCGFRQVPIAVQESSPRLLWRYDFSRVDNVAR
ncbi:GNAT family N-acetyltransferase [Glutamicibacter halophytocola]|uniref:GNAT family N-acetyltransferase n=1 Tax=Glutamicibacter halophytocola TaxID=1933880 RepID=A0A5B8HZZ9_9MICC|nr:GNAT family N-acetyltransferase [Glutamicibacter halophytocola]QDY65765.1 GNAT family N-acetyltransferase [Glutamicibacter halophytocola]UUX57867.1 GNAT family N-acetyltransferase [Glutamicibacter halophytocola]